MDTSLLLQITCSTKLKVFLSKIGMNDKEEQPPPIGEFDANDDYWKKELNDAYQRQLDGKADAVHRVKEAMLFRVKKFIDHGHPIVYIPFNEVIDLDSCLCEYNRIIDELNKTTIYQFRRSTNGVQAELKPLNPV